MHHHETPDKRQNDRKGMTIALVITSLIMLLEFVGGLVTNSLALLSDSGHMLSDTSSLLFSLIAMVMAVKPATDSKHFGYQRIEILAAFINGLTLAVIAVLIIIEAYKRFLVPESVQSEIMIGVASIGLLANLLSAWFLLRNSDVKGNINIRSAYLHIIGDALGSVGAIMAGLFMHFYSLYIADPIISAVIALMIFKSALGVIKQSVHILMEGKPHSISTPDIESTLLCIEGVKGIHDLRIWTITSGIHSFCCHLVIDEHASHEEVLTKAVSIVKDRFGCVFATVQIETVSCYGTE